MRKAGPRLARDDKFGGRVVRGKERPRRKIDVWGSRLQSETTRRKGFLQGLKPGSAALLRGGLSPHLLKNKVGARFPSRLRTSRKRALHRQDQSKMRPSAWARPSFVRVN